MWNLKTNGGSFIEDNGPTIWNTCTYCLCVVHFYPQWPFWSTTGPMNYTFTVAAVLASGVHWGGSTEFDKAARPERMSKLHKLCVRTNISWILTYYISTWKSHLPEHKFPLVLLHSLQTARPCPGCTQWISPEHGGQQEPDESSDQSPVGPLTAVWDGRMLAGLAHSYTRRDDRELLSCLNNVQNHWSH